MFTIRPFWRWQTQGTYSRGFNAIMNWNDLDPGPGPLASFVPRHVSVGGDPTICCVAVTIVFPCAVRNFCVERDRAMYDSERSLGMIGFRRHVNETT